MKTWIKKRVVMLLKNIVSINYYYYFITLRSAIYCTIGQEFCRIFKSNQTLSFCVYRTIVLSNAVAKCF